MPDILWPIKWLIELILTAFHTAFTAVGLHSNWGVTWVLSIVCLVLVVRTALIPIFVRQIKSQRNMMLVQPELAKLQKKYKGKTDRESREKFAQEQMALYKRTGSNPLSSCLPMLLQMPIFFSLFSTLQSASRGQKGVGVMSEELASSFKESSFLGAPLQHSLSTADGNIAVWILGVSMIVAMTASQFITQKQIMAKNQNAATQTTQYMQTQKIMLYAFPLIFAVSGIAFPLGLMFYWLTSNFWTMGQQYFVIRRMPTPGSKAFAERQERLAKKGKLVEVIEELESDAETIDIVRENSQRAQPVSKKRNKKRK
ncbi:MAG: membrane protein insertase YidC [Rhodoluna sp.]|nr:membrane protein insertase YidC [Rhodoluna sp.]